MTKILLILTLIASCGKKSSSNPSAEVSQPPAVVELPANSAEVSSVEDLDLRTLQVSIRANRKFGPSVFDDGWFYAPKELSFYLPASISVVAGRSGNHLLILTVTRAQDSLKCIYLGKGSNTAQEFNSAARAYDFDFCVEASVSVTPGGRVALRDSSSNILPAAQRDQTELTLSRGDKINVSVNNGNHRGPGGNVTTTVLTDLLFTF